MELANKFPPTIVVEIPNSRNTVAFKTPMVLKKPPLLIFQQASSLPALSSTHSLSSSASHWHYGCSFNLGTQSKSSVGATKGTTFHSKEGSNNEYNKVISHSARGSI